MFNRENKEKKEKRFIVKEQCSLGLGYGVVEIIVDTQTGVNYLASFGIDINNITPLLDSDGNVIVDEEYIN